MKDRMKGKIEDYWKQQSQFKKTMDILGILICLAGIGTSFYMNFVDRSLWVDEAWLAASFSKRSIFELTNEVFEMNQCAPVLYLYIVKIITLMFGNTEFTLRIFSVISYGLTLLLSWYIAKHLFKIRYATLCSAFIANIGILLKYSNMFKQYMFECVVVLLVLLVYYFYKEKRMSLKAVIPSYMIMIWAANPACFMIGGVLAWEFISGLMKNDKKQITASILCGGGVLISFTIYYFYWLREVANSEYMQDYWIESVFPLIPKNINDIEKAIRQVIYIFKFGTESKILAVMMGAIVFAGLSIGMLNEKNRYVIVTAFCFFLALFASWLRMFPMANRLWLFAYPLFSVMVFLAIEHISLSNRLIKYKNENKYMNLKEIVVALTVIIFIITGNNMINYWNKDNIYKPRYEINSFILYIQENIKNDESVFIENIHAYTVKYKIGYNTDTINGKNRIIWMENTSEANIETSISEIVKAEKCYIIEALKKRRDEPPLIVDLREKGELRLISAQYDTLLYYFETFEANK